MLTEAQTVDLYRERTDGNRDLVRWTLDNARHEQRVKLDEETHLLTEFDYEECATWDERMRQATTYLINGCARSGPA